MKHRAHGSRPPGVWRSERDGHDGRIDKQKRHIHALFVMRPGIGEASAHASSPAVPSRLSVIEYSIVATNHNTHITILECSDDVAYSTGTGLAWPNHLIPGDQTEMSGAGCVNLEHNSRIVMHADASRTPLAMSWKSHGSTVKVRCRIYGVRYI